MCGRKCIDGDSDHQTSTGIRRHRLRALFERDGYGNTTGADGLNMDRTVERPEHGSRFVRGRTLRVREGR